MKIVFVIPDMAGGGTERVISLLANEYAAGGIAVGILLFAGNETAYPLDPRVEVYSAGLPSGGSGRERWKRLVRMRKYFRRNKGCDIFSFSTIGTGFVVLSTIGLHRRLLVSERIDPNSCDHKPYRNFFYRFARALVCQTLEAAESFPKAIRRKAVVIPNPIDPALPQPYHGERKRWIVTAGRLEPQKNQALLLQAFALFAREYPDYSLHLYGKGRLEADLKELAENLKLSDRIVFHGFCPKVREEIADSAMFVLSSDYEGISNSMAEALAMGVPVIATDCPPGGCRAYIQDGSNGLLVPMGDAAALSQAMRRVASDKALAAALSENGAKLRERYPVRVIAADMLRALEATFKE